MQEQYAPDVLVEVEDVIVKKNTPIQKVETSKVLPINKLDHVRGGDSAKVTIIEYSDLDCPYCALLHGTLQTLVDEYDGEVAWVYRHFPLTALHPNAEIAAQVSECVAAKGGDEAFWKFVDGYFSEDIGKDFSKIKATTGVAYEDLTACLEAETYKNKIASQAKNAKDTGGTGTPWSILIGPNGTHTTITGAQPIAVWQAEIDALLHE
jgi:protein-disulfide isomerase